MENSIICVVVVTIIIVIMARFQLDVTPMYLLSEQNAGQKYKYRIMFKLQSCKDIGIRVKYTRSQKKKLRQSNL